MAWQRKYDVSSHENFDHENIKSVGYDWDFAANPKIAARRPLRIYLPETTNEVVDVVREVNKLGLKLRVRSRGHSSNNLVLGDRDTAVLWTEFLRKPAGAEGEGEDVGSVDLQSGSVWVMAGAELAKVDEALEKQGYGLPVIGDHNHITAGGFASVGGVSPASNKHGMFVDNIQEIEWVPKEGGGVRYCGPEKSPRDFFSLLGGTGQHGVITRIRCTVIKAVKTRDLLRNCRQTFWNLDNFVEGSARRIREPGSAVMERGLWLDYPLFGSRSLRIGQYSGYVTTPRTRWKALRDRVIHGFLHGLGYFAGRVWGWLDRIIQVVGIIGVIWAPRYASMKNVESFADKVLDSSVGDPHRMLIVFARVEVYEKMFNALHDLCREFRHRGCVTFFALYVKGITSRYLSLAYGERTMKVPCCEILLYLGLKPDEMTDRALAELVERIDGLCRDMDGMRYMHTRTVAPDHPDRQVVDPNARVLAELGMRRDGADVLR